MQQYHFYVQLYPAASDGDTMPVRRDLLSAFGAIYRSLSNTAPGEVKNQYSEEYAEAPAPRLYIPASPVHSPTEQVLSLYFKGASCARQSRELYQYLLGRKFEFSDDFRSEYRTFLLKSMSIKGERLYGGQRYQMVEFSLTNIYGRAFSDSQISPQQSLEPLPS